ncbi:hypothetical protein A2U01_0058797, partial [Trifolium medium]|nr:hypothetical protein [Trifolium medium]
MISDLLVESQLIDDLEKAEIFDEVEVEVEARRTINGRSLRYMELNLDATILEEEDVETILKIRVKIDDFPIFTQLDPLEVLEDYL